MLNMYDGIFMSVTTFENRYIYIMNRDCTIIELFDSEANDTMCTILPLKSNQNLFRTVFLPLDEDEILYLRNEQDSESEGSGSG